MWVIFPILGYVPIFHGLWVIRTVGCFPCGLYSYPSRKRPRVDASIFDSLLSHTCRSDASEKREENSVSTFGRFRQWTSFEYPVSVKGQMMSNFKKLILMVRLKYNEKNSIFIEKKLFSIEILCTIATSKTMSFSE